MSNGIGFFEKPKLVSLMSQFIPDLLSDEDRVKEKMKK